MTLNEETAYALGYTKCEERVHSFLNDTRTFPCGLWRKPRRPHGITACVVDPPNFSGDRVASDELLEAMRAEGFTIVEWRYPDETLLQVFSGDAQRLHKFNKDIDENRCKAFLATRPKGFIGEFTEPKLTQEQLKAISDAGGAIPEEKNDD